MKEEVSLLKADSDKFLEVDQDIADNLQREDAFNTALGFGMGMEVTGALDFLSSVKQSNEVIDADHDLNTSYHHTDFSDIEDIEELSMDELDLL